MLFYTKFGSLRYIKSYLQSREITSDFFHLTLYITRYILFQIKYTNLEKYIQTHRLSFGVSIEWVCQLHFTSTFPIILLNICHLLLFPLCISEFCPSFSFYTYPFLRIVFLHSFFFIHGGNNNTSRVPSSFSTFLYFTLLQQSNLLAILLRNSLITLL